MCMKKNRTLFLAGFDEKSPLIMHCVSRVNGRQMLFGDEEKDAFVGFMRMYEKFCGVKVLTYCVMTNHFHLLVEIPPAIDAQEAAEMSDADFLARLSYVYSAAYVKEVKRWMQVYRKNKATKAMRELKEKYTYRMGNISEFMKTLKQRFSRWYNKLHGRKGTLWEERYSATAVSAGSAARMVAAYIDLNPLRANMLGTGSSSRSSAGDPKDYRWSSYAEAVAGDAVAMAGYVHLYQGSDRPGAEVEKLTSKPKEVLARYRMLLAEEGQEAEVEQADSQSKGRSAMAVQGERKSKRMKRRRGFSRAEVDEILERNGKLSRTEMLRCRVRYFTDGAVIGSKSFVNDFYKAVKGEIRGERKKASTPLRNIDLEDEQIYSYRDLQKDVLG